MPDFVEDLKNDILESMPDTSPDWAELCAIMPLAVALPNARIIEKTNELKLNIIALMVGHPGIKKSLPIFFKNCDQPFDQS